MSLSRNVKRLEAKCKKNGTEVPVPNLHIAHKKARKFGKGVVYDSKTGNTGVFKEGI